MTKKSNEIVIFKKGGDFCTTSIDVAEKFDKSHKSVLRAISNLECSDDFTKRNFAPSEYKDSTGRVLEMYNITRDGFSFLGMGFTGKIAAKWKEKYIAAFNKLETLAKQNLERQVSESYIRARVEGKKFRLEETDAIKEFVEYATLQGSKNAKMYYVNISKMENQALFYLVEGMPKPTNIREVVNTFQLFELGVADKMVSDTIKECMQKNMYYKDIFSACKQKIEAFAMIAGKTPIPYIEHTQYSLLN